MYIRMHHSRSYVNSIDAWYYSDPAVSEDIYRL